MTIKDIAKKCGVSVSTVSRVLNDHPDVSAANREKVLSVVRELHFVPNSSARDLVRSPSDTIGLVVRGVGNPFFTDIIYAVEEACEAAGYTMVLHQIRSGEDELRAGAELARSKRLRGLILLGGQFDYAPEKTAALGIPFVCCTYTNSFGTLPPDTYSSVSIDDRKEAYKLVRLLTEQGHRKIAVILDSVEDHSISQLRYNGYCQALADSGIELDPGLIEETDTFEMADGYTAMERLLRRRDDFTAVFVVADALAVAAMKALHDHGMRVPEDCSVVAIDGIEMSAYTVPTLTTLVQPRKELGRESVGILVDMIEGRGKNRHLLLDTSTRMGGSVRCF
ncbi:MAG: LacI family transcriptional regulator [Ruminococcaceae bacterium]|nr:LacI family transcriptional regulator [Oscillospiraceae bacterium]